MLACFNFILTLHRTGLALDKKQILTLAECTDVEKPEEWLQDALRLGFASIINNNLYTEHNSFENAKKVSEQRDEWNRRQEQHRSSKSVTRDNPNVTGDNSNVTVVSQVTSLKHIKDLKDLKEEDKRDAREKRGNITDGLPPAFNTPEFTEALTLWADYYKNKVRHTDFDIIQRDALIAPYAGRGAHFLASVRESIAAGYKRVVEKRIEPLKGCTKSEQLPAREPPKYKPWQGVEKGDAKISQEDREYLKKAFPRVKENEVV